MDFPDRYVVTEGGDYRIALSFVENGEASFVDIDEEYRSTETGEWCSYSDLEDTMNGMKVRVGNLRATIVALASFLPAEEILKLRQELPEVLSAWTDLERDNTMRMLLMADGSVCGPMCCVWKRYTENRWIAEWCSRPGTRAAFTLCLTKEEALRECDKQLAKSFALLGRRFDLEEVEKK